MRYESDRIYKLLVHLWIVVFANLFLYNTSDLRKTKIKRDRRFKVRLQHSSYLEYIYFEAISWELRYLAEKDVRVQTESFLESAQQKSSLPQYARPAVEDNNEDPLTREK